MSWPTTKGHNLGAGPHVSDLFTDAQKVECVTAFVCLGSKYVSDSNSFSECARCSSIGILLQVVQWKCVLVFGRDETMSLETKFRLYSTCDNANCAVGLRF